MPLAPPGRRHPAHLAALLCLAALRLADLGVGGLRLKVAKNEQEDLSGVASRNGQVAISAEMLRNLDSEESDSTWCQDKEMKYSIAGGNEEFDDAIGLFDAGRPSYAFEDLPLCRHMFKCNKDTPCESLKTGARTSLKHRGVVYKFSVRGCAKQIKGESPTPYEEQQERINQVDEFLHANYPQEEAIFQTLLRPVKTFPACIGEPPSPNLLGQSETAEIEDSRKCFYCGSDWNSPKFSSIVASRYRPSLSPFDLKGWSNASLETEDAKTWWKHILFMEMYTVNMFQTAQRKRLHDLNFVLARSTDEALSFTVGNRSYELRLKNTNYRVPMLVDPHYDENLHERETGITGPDQWKDYSIHRTFIAPIGNRVAFGLAGWLPKMFSYSGWTKEAFLGLKDQTLEEILFNEFFDEFRVK